MKIAYLNNNIVRGITSVKADTDLVELAKSSGCDIVEIKEDDICEPYMKYEAGEFIATTESIQYLADKEKRFKSTQKN